MKLPGDDNWTLGTCKKQVAPRSYLVDCNGMTYRRNRQHLRKTNEYIPMMQQPFEQDTDDIDIEPNGTNTADNNELVTVPVSSPPKTSSFGRIIKPPRRFVEQSQN